MQMFKSHRSQSIETDIYLASNTCALYYSMATQAHDKWGSEMSSVGNIAISECRWCHNYWVYFMCKSTLFNKSWPIFFFKYFISVTFVDYILLWSNCYAFVIYYEIHWELSNKNHTFFGRFWHHWYRCSFCT